MDTPINPQGILVLDKPSGWTSHDVVARTRRLLGTRKVGHAGTLDPMATGVLVLGAGRGTKLLTDIVPGLKGYSATIRLGLATTTDDREGEAISGADASRLTMTEVEAAAAPLRGLIAQVPSTISAIKVDGRRAYAMARDGQDVELPARQIEVHEFVLSDLRSGAAGPWGETVQLEARVLCSAGTYVRALARDLGDALGVGGHLTALRRTQVGGFGITDAVSLEEFERDPHAHLMPLGQAASAFLTRVVVDDPDVVAGIRHGARVAWADSWPEGKVAFVDSDGELLAIGSDRIREGARVASWSVVFAG